MIEEKLACDLISLVANAIKTDTVAEAIEYLTQRYNEDDEVIHHTYNVLNKMLCIE